MAVDPAVSSRFQAWMTLWGAIIALASSLLTAILANIFEALRDAKRRRHENQTRFHQERFTAYRAYINALSTVASVAHLWKERGSAQAFVNSNVTVMNSYMDARAGIGLLTKSELTDKDDSNFTLFKDLLEKIDSPTSPDLVKNLADQLEEASQQFKVAAKQELGIEEAPVKRSTRIRLLLKKLCS